MVKRRCIECGLTKAIGEFAILEHSIDGLACCCDECMQKYIDTAALRSHENELLIRDQTAQVQSHRMGIAKSHNIAMKFVRRAIKDGTLKKKPCRICGDRFSQPCHPDTTLPQEVEWYCLAHHPFAVPCSRCKEIRIAVDYPLAKHNVSYRSTVCKLCRREERLARLGRMDEIRTDSPEQGRAWPQVGPPRGNVP